MRIGIIQYKSAEKVEQTFGPIVEYMAEKSGMKAELTIVNDDDLGFQMNNGDFDLGIFTAFPYLKAKQDFPDLSVFATHLVDGKEYYSGYILTGPKIKNFSDLKKKRLLFVKESSTSGFKIPNGVLREHNIDIDVDYLTYDFSGDHTASLWALDSGNVDAIAVDDRRFKSFKGPNKSNFNVLSEFTVPYHAYVFSPSSDDELRNKISELLFNLHKDPEARKLLENPLDVTQVTPKDDDYYNDLRRYMRIVRVKPSVVVAINPTENVLASLGGQRDLIPLIEGRIQQELQNSNRFSVVNIEEGKATYRCTVDLFSTEEGILSYQVKSNDRFIGDGEIAQKEFRKKMPLEFSQWLLKSLPLETEMLYNGEDWFITFGTNDGVTATDYQFDVFAQNGQSVSLGKKEIHSATALNIFFKENPAFVKGSKVVMNYKTPVGQSSVLSISDEGTDTYNIFSRNFWKGAGFWDKLGLIGGILIALASAIIGKILANRKKQRFKNILYQTNDLIKEYVEGQFKLETRLIEQKEFISQALEDGHINENQFLILKNRIEDMQALIEFHSGKGDIHLADQQADEIREIVSDGKITEREFSKIMSIIKKGVSGTSTSGINN